MVRYNFKEEVGYTLAFITDNYCSLFIIMVTIQNHFDLQVNFHLLASFVQ